MRIGINRGGTKRQDRGDDLKGSPGPAYPLTAAAPCKIVQVVNTTGGRNHRARLAAMGVTPGSVLKVCCNLGGPLIVEVKGSRLSMGRGMASRVLVESKADAGPCECPEDKVCPKGQESDK
jgi:Fe2+ transport system protein FeoA